ncbi:MAG: hypothetical protein J6564_05900, partial [Gilliamella sp.]
SKYAQLGGDSSESDVDWFVWGVIVNKYATLHELRTVYSLDDVIDMHNVIAETKLAEKQQQQSEA